MTTKNPLLKVTAAEHVGDYTLRLTFSTGNGRFDHLCLKKEQFCTKWKHILDSGIQFDRKMYEQFSKESKKIDRINERRERLPQLIGNQKDYYCYLIKASVKTLFQVACKLSENYPHSFKKANKKTLKRNNNYALPPNTTQSSYCFSYQAVP